MTWPAFIEAAELEAAAAMMARLAYMGPRRPMLRELPQGPRRDPLAVLRASLAPRHHAAPRGPGSHGLQLLHGRYAGAFARQLELEAD